MNEFNDSLEFLKSRFKYNFVKELGAEDFADNILNYLRSRKSPKLFFSQNNLSKIAELAIKYDPDESAWEKEIADNAVEGRIYGASNPYCDRFLRIDKEHFDFSFFDHPDPETIHALNRHRVIGSLARTYWLNCDPVYFNTIMDYWDFHTSKVPMQEDKLFSRIHAMGKYQCIKPPYHELDNFIRLTNWWWGFWLTLFAKEITPERCVLLLARCLRLFDLVAARGIHLHKSNFTSMQMESLYLWSASLPEVTGMNVWKANVRNTMESCMAQAVYADGVQWEKSMGYHCGCISWYGSSYLLGLINGDKWADEYGELLQKMGNYLDKLITPDGKLPLLSDSDRNNLWEAAFSLLKIIVPNINFHWQVSPSYYSLWVSNGTEFNSTKLLASESTVELFEDSGLCVARTGYASDDSTIILDNGPSDAGHSHLDNMTLHYEALGKPVIVDPGRAVYREDSDRAWVRSVESHNTTYIEDQEIKAGDYIKESVLPRFMHCDPRIGNITNEVLDNICFLKTSIRGFIPEPNAMVRRSVVFPLKKEEPWLVVCDRIYGENEHNWTTSWLFPATEPLAVIDDGYEIILDEKLRFSFSFLSSNKMEKRDDSMFWFQNYSEKSPARWVRLSSLCSTGVRVFILKPAEISERIPEILLDGMNVCLRLEKREFILTEL